MAIVFLVLPVFLLLLNAICIFVTLKDNEKKQNKKIINLVFTLIPIISFLSFGISFAAVFDIPMSEKFVFSMLIGGVFMLIGNYLPKCTRNKTVGIKIKWTLLNEENWNATHRFCGKLWFFVGCVLILYAFLPEKAALVFSFATMLFLVLTSFLFSYFYYRKQLKNGSWKEDEADFTYSKRTKILSGVIVGIILVFCVVISFTGKISITLTNDEIQMEATYWTDNNIKLSEIENIEYREKVEGRKISGYNSPKLHIGLFKNEEFGSYTRYTYTENKSCIVLTVNGNKIVINLKTKEETKELYENILSKQEKLKTFNDTKGDEKNESY
jgi:uncharacterized membrane protein